MKFRKLLLALTNRLLPKTILRQKLSKIQIFRSLKKAHRQKNRKNLNLKPFRSVLTANLKTTLQKSIRILKTMNLRRKVLRLKTSLLLTQKLTLQPKKKRKVRKNQTTAILFLKILKFLILTRLLKKLKKLIILTLRTILNCRNFQKTTWIPKLTTIFPV